MQMTFKNMGAKPIGIWTAVFSLLHCCFGQLGPVADFALDGHAFSCGNATSVFKTTERLSPLAPTPNDPGFLDGTIWGLDNTGQNGGVGDVDIDAPEGWAVEHDAGGVIVAVLDSGIRYTHEDLAANMWVNPGEIPDNGIDDDHDGYIDDLHGINALEGTGNPMDDHHHGTFVAGILGAVGNNGKGGIGVAWKVKIMACKMLAANGAGTEEATIAAIDYARLHGAQIINASWNYPDYSERLRAAILRAREAGIVFVVSAGNAGIDIDRTPSYPPSYGLDNILIVTSVDHAGQMPANANFGAATVHLAAPGSTIYAPWFESDSAYAYANGTSMAAPHVAGICALLKARYPSENYKQIILRLIVSAKPLASLAGKCQTGGIASLAGALHAPMTPAFDALPSRGFAPLRVAFTNLSIGSIDGVRWNFGDGSSESHEVNPVHVYSAPGRFDAILTISDGANRARSQTNRIEVLPFDMPLKLSLASSSVAGSISLQLQGSPGQSIEIQTSTNLIDWTAIISDRIPTDGYFNITNDASAMDIQRFYRGRNVLPE
jgi:subtilisin family serine protease